MTAPNYEKPALTFEQQADLLLERGLLGDRAEIISRLESVNYYRFSGYLYPFRVVDKQGLKLDQYREGTTLSEVWDRYCFDRRLRMLLLDAIERFEVSLRTRIINQHSLKHGPFGYGDQQHFSLFSNRDYLDWRTKLEEETRRSKESFVRHFKDKYNKSHPVLPFWMLGELMSMGSLVTLFKHSEAAFQKEAANCYGLSDQVLGSWLLCLYGIRNLCAHHARLWNRKLGVSPLLPRAPKSPLWPKDFEIKQDQVGIALLLCRYLLRVISPSSQWYLRVEALFQEYCNIPLPEMGLPDEWNTHPVWAEKTEFSITRLHASA